MSQDDDHPGDARRGVRKAVDIDCEFIRPDRDEPIRCKARDLSPSGIWLVTTELLEPGAQLVVTFRPPHWPSPFSITVFGEVARVSKGRRTADEHQTGMGIEFTDLSDPQREALDACLQGLPPPLPRHRKG